MAGKKSAFNDPDARQTFAEVAREAFHAGGGAVCCPVLFYPTKPGGGPQEPPQPAPEGMKYPVYCWRHERWVNLQAGHAVLYLPEKDDTDFTGGAYD